MSQPNTPDQSAHPLTNTIIQTFQNFLHTDASALIITSPVASDRTQLFQRIKATSQLSQEVIELQGQHPLNLPQLVAYMLHHWNLHLELNHLPPHEQLSEIRQALNNEQLRHLLLINNAEALTLPVLAGIGHLIAQQETGSTQIHIGLIGHPSLLEKIDQINVPHIPRIDCTAPTSIHIVNDTLQQKAGRVTPVTTPHHDPLSTDDSTESHEKKLMPQLTHVYKHHKVKLIACVALLIVTMAMPTFFKEEKQSHEMYQEVRRAPLPTQHTTQALNKTTTQSPILFARHLLAHARRAMPALTQTAQADVSSAAMTPTPIIKQTPAPDTTPHQTAPEKITAQHSTAHTTRQQTATQHAQQTIYTIQILGSYQAGALHHYIDLHRLSRAQIMTTTRRGQPWYVITYGYFLSKEQADRALKQLPSNLKRQRPWVRTTSSLKPFTEKPS